MSLEVKLQVFEGPLDLLLHLIDKNQIDIYDIPIATITEQYMAYINAMQRDDMDVTSEFLVMAATLIIHKGITAIFPIQAFVVAAVDDFLDFGLRDLLNTDMVAAQAPW